MDSYVGKVYQETVLTGHARHSVGAVLAQLHRASAITLTQSDRGTRQPVQAVPLAVFKDNMTTATV